MNHEFLRISKMTENEFEEARQWYESRPDCIKQMIRRQPPGQLYTLKTTGQLCKILSYGEDGTLRICAWREEIPGFSERQVFGINPDDLMKF